MTPRHRHLGAVFLCVAVLSLGTASAQTNLPEGWFEKLSRANQLQVQSHTKSLQEILRLFKEDRFREAIPLVEKVSADFREALGETHPLCVLNLDTLSALYALDGRFGDAVVTGRKNLEIVREARKQPWEIAVARLRLNDLEFVRALGADGQRRYIESTMLIRKGNALAAEDRRREAIDLLTRGLAIRSELRQTPFAGDSDVMNTQGLLHQDLGEYPKAESLFRRALEIATEQTGSSSPDAARGLNNLGLVFAALGDHVRAIEHFRRAREIWEKTVGETTIDNARTLYNLGAEYSELSDYPRAESCLTRALEIKKAKEGEQNVSYIWNLERLGRLYFDAADYARAESAYRKVLELRKKLHGDDHPLTASALSQLARVYRFSAEGKSRLATLRRAEPLLQRALEIREKAPEGTEAERVQARMDLGFLYRAMDDPARAEPSLRSAEAYYRHKLDACRDLGTPRHASLLGALSCLQEALGRHAEAERSFATLVEVQEKGLAAHSVGFAYLLTRLGDEQSALGRHALAAATIDRALTILRTNQELAAAVQSERQQLQTVHAHRAALDDYLTVGVRAGLPAEDLYERALSWKGLVFARQRWVRMARARGEADPEAARLLGELERVSGRLMKLVGGGSDTQRRRAEFQALTEERERLEGALSARGAGARETPSWGRRSPRQVREALPPGTALVDVLEVYRTEPTPEGGGKPEGEWRLLAFVVRPDAPTRLVDLGPVKPISEAVDRWRAAVQKKNADLAPAGAELRRLVWEPLQDVLQSREVVLISPDGPLTRMPLGALPGGRPGSYLIEEVPIAVVPVPQLLPELAGRPGDRAAAPPAPTASLLLVGDVDFGAAPGVTRTRGVSHSAPRGERAGALPDFSPLRATREEIVAVRDSFEQSYPDGQVRVLRARDATEAALRNQVARYRWLHLSTHGFFAPKGLRSALEGIENDAAAARGPAAPAGPEESEAVGLQGFHPGLLSGLALAGANRRVTGDEDDGILTALEVAELDLAGVELVALSACETGLGEAAGGEGLLGIQRSFQIAGARTVVGSYWQVDDEATRKIMVLFYENLWRGRMSKLKALRQAQLWMLREGARRGLVPAEESAKAGDQSPPYYWAAFVLSGDWQAPPEPRSEPAARGPGDTLDEAPTPDGVDQRIGELSKALEANPRDPAVLVRRGQVHYTRRDIPAALADFTRAIESDRTNARAFVARGRVFAEEAEFDQAISDANQALRIEPGLAEAYCVSARAYSGRSEDDQALADCADALKRDARCAEAYSIRGEIYLCQKAYDNAIAELDRAIRIRPGDVAYLRLRFRAYRDKKDTERAKDALEAMCRIEPKTLLGYHDRAWAFNERKDYEKALEDCDRALHLNDRFFPAYIERGYAYRKLKRYDEARADFTRAIRLRPESTEGYRNRAELATDTGDRAALVADYSEVLRRDPGNVKARYERGDAYTFLKKYAEAVTDFTEVLRLKPDDQDALYERGFAHWKRREYVEGVADFTEAIRLKPDDIEALRVRGHCYRESKDYARAIADYTEAIRLKPGYEVAYGDRAYASMQTGDLTRAIADYSEAVRLKPTSAYYLAQRAAAYRKGGDYARALADYEEAVRLDPNAIDPLACAAWVLATCPDDGIRESRKALKYANQACQLSGWRDPVLLTVLSAAYAESGDFEQAVKWLRQAIESPLPLPADKRERASVQMKLYQDHKPYRETPRP
jgi:tetratricopeptide (TPR) repeat protein